LEVKDEPYPMVIEAQGTPKECATFLIHWFKGFGEEIEKEIKTKYVG